MRTTQTLLESTDPRWIRIAGMVRRMAISLTSKVLWQLVGFRLPDGSQEVINAEAFTGIGFFARAPSSGEPEAIVVSVGDANAPMIIAVRDEKTRAANVGALKVGETAMYTDKAIVYLKDDGTIEARSAAGGANPTINATAYRSAEDTLLTALNTYVLAIKSVADPTNAATPALTAAISTFQASASSYLTTKFKAE